LKIHGFRGNRQSIDKTFLPGVNKITFSLVSCNFMIVCQKRTSWCVFILHHSFIPLACAEWDDSLPFSGASYILLCYIPFPSTLFHQVVFHPPSLHLAIYFLVYLSALLLPNSYIILHHAVQNFNLVFVFSASLVRFFIPEMRLQPQSCCTWAASFRFKKSGKLRKNYIL